MALKLYNTLTKSKEEFKPLHAGKVSLYTCGPTVYWTQHIGNLRTYIFEDILRKTLDVNIEIARGVMASGVGSALAMSLDVGKLGTIIGTNTYKIQ